jgi:hypothetical protein
MFGQLAISAGGFHEDTVSVASSLLRDPPRRAGKPSTLPDLLTGGTKSIVRRLKCRLK